MTVDPLVVLNTNTISEELATSESLAKGPGGGSHIVGDNAAAVACGDLEGESLAVEVAVALPVLPPVPRHRLPRRPGPLDRHGAHVPGPGDVGDEDQVEVGVAIDGEPHSTSLLARDPVGHTRK